ncbi:SAM-dependent methyltransferase [Desulfosporosinus sp. HMP52]|uniref:peptide chain release factor N(5)-glutamine methyltransferase n=1 Tax=Desulfosporosinus sp. HMP52 TaxID=1487923 RepID=UPI00051FA260|nr:peptide chain release factor N(5)-glutamine methyltransferase [Desulfosporosinus sp. HMP52]KGK86628.1 SAM-dependent methyltransferase [Desulfosporosinus sp. HMP52]
MKVIDGMRWGESELLKKGIDNSRFDADLLLAEVLKVTRDRLYLDWDRILSEQESEHYQKLIQRRSENVPLQYILGRQEFMGLSFYVDERVLIPRADSEVLVEKCLDILRQDHKNELVRSIRVADLCTGSGVLAISLAHFFPSAEVLGVDLSPGALEVAQLNAKQLGVPVQWRQGDFVESIRGEYWDYVITNPPYVSAEDYRQCAPEIFHEPVMAFLGGTDGLDFYRRLANEIRPLLNPQGKVLMEIGWNQAEAVCKLFQLNGFKTEVFSDLAGRDRVILAR